MATLPNNYQDQQQNQQNTPGSNVPITGTSAGGSGSGKGVGAPGASQVQQNPNPQNQQGYTDVSSYLNANQQGGNQLGQQVAQNLNQGYQTTQNDINNSVNTANSAISSGYTPENTQLIQQAESNPTGFAYNATTTPGTTPQTPTAQSGAVNPIAIQYNPTGTSTNPAATSPTTTYTPNTANINAFQGQLNDTYTGPTSWADYGTLQGEVGQAQQNASLVNAPGGNNALIQQVENQTNPGQTGAGINALDTLLFQGNPNAVATAQAAAAPYANLGTYLDTQNTNVGNNITAAQNAAAQTSQDALNAFTGTNGTLTNLNNAVTNTANQDLTQAQTQQTQLAQDIQNLYGGVAANTTPTTITGYGGSQNPWYNTQNYTVGSLSPADLSELGLTAAQGTALQQAMQQAGTSQYETGHNFGAASPTSQIDLSQFLNQQAPTASMINPGTVATPEQYQETAAINQLLGSKTPQGEILNPAMAAEAGTYNPANLNSFNYQGALSNAQNVSQQEIAAAQQEAQALTGAADLAHAQSQHGGGFLNGLEQDIIHPLSTIGSAIDPLTWGANLENIANGQQVSPTNVNPLKPHAAHGGDISDYLEKRKK